MIFRTCIWDIYLKMNELRNEKSQSVTDAFTVTEFGRGVADFAAARQTWYIDI